MTRDPADLRYEAAAYRALALEIDGETMTEALQQAASALDALALELEAAQAKLTFVL